MGRNTVHILGQDNNPMFYDLSILNTHMRTKMPYILNAHTWIEYVQLFITLLSNLYLGNMHNR